MTLRPVCPDWRGLAAARDERDGDAWEAALAHLDGGCRGCRDAAYAADPTLVFRRLPAAAPAPGEVADLAAAVRAMVRADRVEALPASDFEALTRPVGAEEAFESPASPLPRRSALRWRVASLAAGLVALLLGTAPVAFERPREVASVPTPSVASSFGTEFVAGVLPTGSSSGDPVEIETLDRPSANVYQFDDPGMAVVLIVDSGLDV